MDVNYFFKDRKLRKIAVDMDKSKGSIKTSEMKLGEAKKLFDSEFFNQALLSAYTSMFHAARAILYKEGVQEKSHYAVFIYLRDRYSDKLPASLIESFLYFQKERKEILYGFEYDVDKNRAENSILDAEEFLFKVKEVLESG